MQIKDLMTRDVACCRVDDTLNVAAQLMMDRDCGSVPVVDSAGRAVGMLTDRDICFAAHKLGVPLAEIRVADAMSTHLRVCSPSDDVIDVARKCFAKYQIRRVPVVGSEGRLVGILSFSDFARTAHSPERPPRTGVGADAIETTLVAICRPGHAAAV